MRAAFQKVNKAHPPDNIPRSHQTSVHMFLKRAYETMLTEKEMKRRDNSKLKSHCTEALQELCALTAKLNDVKQPAYTDSDGKNGFQSEHQSRLLLNAILLQPLVCACESRNSPKLTVVAIDCLQKLIAYGHVTNEMLYGEERPSPASSGSVESSGSLPQPSLTSGAMLRLIEYLVDLICQAFQSDNTDEGVMLQIVKALLTVMTSPVVEIHEKYVMNVFRTCYNIFMASRNPVNQLTARATLTQMLNDIFQRMEHASMNEADMQRVMKEKAIPHCDSNELSSPAVSVQENNMEKISVNEEDTKVEEEIQDFPSNGTVEHFQSSELMRMTESQSCSEAGMEPTSGEEGLTGEAVVRELLEDLLTQVAGPPPETPLYLNNTTVGQNGIDIEDETESGIHETDSVDESTMEPVQVVALRPASPLVDAPQSPPPAANSVLPSSSASSSRRVSSPSLQFHGQHHQQQQVRCFAHITQKDAFLVFRSICRLSMKALPEGQQLDTKSHDYRSKILSLELLLSILQNPGPMFKESEVFIDAIRQYLCIALPKNGGSPSTEVFELTLLIFLSLLTHFKQHLKAQIEVFFKEIFLYILETPSSSFEHKLLVTESLGRICLDAQCVFDLYINYDCDMTSANIFEKLVNDLAKVAHGRHAIELGSSALSHERSRLRVRGLECLVYILKCMVEWSRDLYHIPEQQANLLSETSKKQTSGSVRGKDSVSSVANTSQNMSRSNSQNSIPTATDSPEQLETQKQRKENLEKDIQLFNKKSSKGLQMLQSHGFVGESPLEVAKFFMQEDPRLDLTVIGDFLGDAADFNRKVMYAYIDLMEFANMDFVSALRLFLSGFRLPGEAQKIDRLMEKFASRYVQCNPDNGIFTSADTAYVLAFSIIMLTTSLHSSQLKKHNRMTKEEYIKMNKGINDSEDLPQEYLAAIYDEIASRELKMKDSATATASSRLHRSNAAAVNSLAGEKQRRLLFNMEMESMTRAAKALMESVSHRKSDFTSATHVEHVKPMFKIVWTPFLAAFSVSLQDSDDPEVCRLCLEGVRCAIRIACIFHLELERDAYVQALAHFTMLNSSSTASASEIKNKHIDCIKTMISVAHTDGNYLGHSWLEVFRCFSQLESAQLIGQDVSSKTINGLLAGGPPHSLTNSTSLTLSNSGGAHSHHARTSTLSIHNTLEKRGDTLSETSGNAPTTPMASSPAPPPPPGMTTPIHYIQLRVSQEQQQKKLAVIQEVMGETGSQNLVVAVDKIFASSSKLDGDAIVDFVKALCQVSREELSSSPPRIFSLQKLVEISYYNMGRVRLQWSRIWTFIGQHFFSAGRSMNEDVALFAVDSLRQLSVKFIEKGEFANFHFQKDFTRPFVNILEECGNLKIQDMVIHCVAQIVKSHWTNIRSGWTNIFSVFHLVAAHSDAGMVELAFQTCTFVVNEVLRTHFHIVVDSFQGLVKSLAEFACNTHFADVSMEAIRLIRTCARYVHEQSHTFVQRDAFSATSSEFTAGGTASNVTGGANSLNEEDRVWLKGWMPVLCELFRVINSCKLDVRTRGLTVFFEILKTYGGQFTERWWRETFFVVFRVFLHMRASDLQQQQQMKQNAGSHPPTGHSGDTSPTPGGPIIPGQSPLHMVQTAARPLYADKSEWLTTTCNHTLYAVVDVFTQYYEPLHRVLLDDLYHQLRWCCLQEHEQLARSGTSCLENLILCNGHLFSHDIWQKTCDLLLDLFNSSVPHELLTWKPSNRNHMNRQLTDSSGIENTDMISTNASSIERFSHLLIKCVVQYELIQAVDNIVFYPATSRKEDQANVRIAARLAQRSLLPMAGESAWWLSGDSAEWLISEYAQEVAAASLAGDHSDAVSTTSGPGKNEVSPPGDGVPVPPSSSRVTVGRSVSTSSDTFSATGQPLSSAASVQDDSLGRCVAAPLPPWGGFLGFTSVLPHPSPSSFSSVPANSTEANPREGMYAQLTVEQLHKLAQCLMNSHNFAKLFNSNHEQRILLWKAGFKGKAKPNLLKQEVHSLSCALRIYFQLLTDPRICGEGPHLDNTEAYKELEAEVMRVCGEAMQYYATQLTADSHRESWTPVLVLLLSRLLYIAPQQRAQRHLCYHFVRLCHLGQLTHPLPIEVRTLLSRCLLRCGQLHHLTTQ